MYALRPEEVRALQETTDAWLIRRAIDMKIATKPDDLVVRDVLPGIDLNGLSGEVWAQACTAFSYAMCYSGHVPDTKIFALFGVKNKYATPRTAAVKFKIGAGGAHTKDIWQVEHGMLEENTAVFTRDPIKYEKGETFVIENYGISTGGDGVILLGRVCEPRGETIMG